MSCRSEHHIRTTTQRTGRCYVVAFSSSCNDSSSRASRRRSPCIWPTVSTATCRVMPAFEPVRPRTVTVGEQGSWWKSAASLGMMEALDFPPPAPPEDWLHHYEEPIQ